MYMHIVNGACTQTARQKWISLGLYLFKLLTAWDNTIHAMREIIVIAYTQNIMQFYNEEL